MARVFIDGFEGGDLHLWTTSWHGPYVTTGAPDGLYCLNLDATNCWVSKNIPLANRYFFSFWVSFDSVGSDLTVFSIWHGNNLLAALRADTNSGFLRAYVSTTQVDTGTTAIVSNKWYHISMEILLHPTNGIFKVLVDDVININYMAQTQAYPEYPEMNNFRLGSTISEQAGNGVAAHIDNVIVDNSSPIPKTRIQRITVSDQGDITGYNPSTGPQGINWACVDELPASDTDFVSTNTDGQQDLYKHTAVSGTIGAIKSVQIEARAWYEGEALTTQLGLLVKTHGEIYGVQGEPDEVKQLTSGPEYYTRVWDNNPNTGVAWTEQEVNDMQFGIQAIAPI